MARKLNVDARKLDLVAAWREAGVYSEREMAALAWTEALTLTPGTGGTDDLYANLLTQFARRGAGADDLDRHDQPIVGNLIAAGLRFTPPA